MKLRRTEYTTPEAKKKDFWLGFWLWWGINIVMWVVLTALGVLITTGISSDSDFATYLGTAFSIIWGLLPLLINVGLVILLAVTRSQMALGMLVAFGVALALVIVLGVVFAVVCFVLIGASQL